MLKGFTMSVMDGKPKGCAWSLSLESGKGVNKGLFGATRHDGFPFGFPENPAQKGYPPTN